VGVDHEHADKLSLVIVFDEPDACRARNDAQPVTATVVVLPGYGSDPTTDNGLEQSHTLEISQVDAAPMLAFACCADMKRSS
jgi:hypothetical protein